MQTTERPPTHEAPREPGTDLASYRTNLITALLSVWFTVGLFLDAWAHNNVPQLESFFTPWHGVFYSGFAATAGWLMWTVRGTLRNPREPVPAGYAPTVYAVSAFALAGIGDGVWHTVFGIEQNIDVLFSPTHLGLIASMLVIVATPLRSAWADRSLPDAPGPVRLAPAMLGTAFGTTLILLITQYSNVFANFTDRGVVGALSKLSPDFTADFVKSAAVSTLILTLPLLLLARRWTLPPGAATLVYLAVASLSAAIRGFDDPDLAVTLVGAGVAVDLLSWWLRPTARNLVRYRLFGALAPLLTWTILIAASFALNPGLHVITESGSGKPVPELYTGLPAVQGLIGLLMAYLMVPTRHE